MNQEIYTKTGEFVIGLLKQTKAEIDNEVVGKVCAAIAKAKDKNYTPEMVGAAGIDLLKEIAKETKKTDVDDKVAKRAGKIHKILAIGTYEKIKTGDWVAIGKQITKLIKDLTGHKPFWEKLMFWK